MKIVNLIAAAVSCLIIGASPNPSSPECFNSIPGGDSVDFGFALATNDKYLVVGDPNMYSNKVVIYRRDKNGKWIRTRYIFPPEDSTAYKVGIGFGRDLAIDGDVLVIGAYTEQQNHEVKNPKDFQIRSSSMSTFSAIYQTRLDKETEVKRIDVPTEGVIPFDLVVAERGKIGFITSKRKIGFFSWWKEERLDDQVNQIHLLSNGKTEYILPPKDTPAYLFGSDIALKNNLLLVGVGHLREPGKALLYNLNSLQSKPQILNISNASLGSTVALSDRFAAVGDSSATTQPLLLNLPQKTLIRNIKNGSTKVIDGAGDLSLDGNILARMRHRSREGTIPFLLEVFKLDDDATPHLIKKRSDVERALVQNRLLITVQKTNSGKKICTEKVR